MATKKQKRLAGEAAAREQAKREKERNESVLKEVRKKRAARKRSRDIAAHAEENKQRIHSIHKEE